MRFEMDFMKDDDSTAVISDLREQLKRMESRLASIENHEKPDSTNEVSGFNEVEDSASGSHGVDLDTLNNINYLPTIKKCNFTDFKNRFSEEDGCNAVDVLVSGNLFEQEYRSVQALREKLFEHGTSNIPSAKLKQETKTLVRETDRNNAALRNDQSDCTWIRRIRLQAPALLQLLAKVQGESWSNRPRTYSRPFCTLLHFHPKVKLALAELKEKWTTQSEERPTTSARMTPEYEDHDDGLDDSLAALDILRAYVKFIDEEVIPESIRYDNLDYQSEEKILFSDLCYIFKPGEYIYMQIDGEQSTGHDYRMGQRIWRIYFVNDAIRSYNLTPADHRRYSSTESTEDDSMYFTVHCYHIDYTGDEFCVVTNTFRIPPYDKWRPIKSLPVYPARFNANHQKYMDNSQNIGEQVLRFVEAKHAFYNGWTIMRSPQGGFATDPDGAVVKHPEYINSEVMVDFGEAFQACPSWRPKKEILKTEFTNKIIISDEFAIRTWSGRDRARLLRETTEIIPYRTGVHYLKRNQFVLEDPFLVAVAQNHQRGQLTTSHCLRNEEKILLNCRVFAYVFGERKFAQLDVSRLTLSARNFDALEALKIPQATKKLIQGSVRGHFLQKESERGYGDQGLSLDVIQGKGTGLFILLHGVPGVGKTATAEAVAQANGKPLFKITCGDIGLTPDQVETSLRAIFRLASIWDCILLMDEADTFFSQRSKGDSAITKNALVSVFLRVLDYYTGILFLTTNRSGALDEAFKSRIHYKIYYGPLSKDQTMDIWRLNIQRLRHINEQSEDRRPLEIVDSAVLNFAELQFEQSNQRKAGQWNGRQIRNAFQVARSLAYYDAFNETEVKDISFIESPRTAVLDVKYFHMMHNITEDFDHYMLEVFNGQTDGNLALEMEHRADHFKNARPYRSAPTREEFDDYNGYNGRSSLENHPVQDFGGRARSMSNRGLRPIVSVPGNAQRYSPSFVSPLSAAYDETNIEDKPSGTLGPNPPRTGQRHGSLASEGIAADFRNGSSADGDYAFQSSSFNSRFGGGLSQSRNIERGGGGTFGSGLGRDAHGYSNFDTNAGYR